MRPWRKPRTAQDDLITPELGASLKAWRERYDWLSSHFDFDEAHEYAEEMTQVAERQKGETERSRDDIKRDMGLLIKIGQILWAVRLLVVVAICAPFVWQPYFLPDSVIAQIGWTIACWIPAVAIGRSRFGRSASICCAEPGCSASGSGYGDEAGNVIQHARAQRRFQRLVRVTT